ncbi:MAG: kelch repeat-containing protein [Byssovorax sp.]
MSRLVFAGLIASLAACGTSGEQGDALEFPGVEAAAALRQRFPAQAPAVLAQEEGFFAGEEGIFLASGEPSGRLRDLDLTLPRDGADAVRMRAPGGFEVRVREVGAEGAGKIAEKSVAYRRAGGTSFWTAAQGGYEEWLHLSEARAGQAIATWEIEGATVRQQGEEVEVVDGSGVAKIRVSAPSAYAAGGAKVGVALRADGARINLYVEASGEVLVDPAWVAAASMHRPRYGHTATLLPNGAVLVTGGYDLNTNVYQASSEVYIPAENAWQTAVPMSTGRYAHTATLLPGGKVLVTGGWNGQALKLGEVYDIASSTWTVVPQPMNAAHHSHTATLLGSGKVLVVGGAAENGVPEVYDPADQSFHLTGPMGAVRQNHTATLLGNGTVLVAGGSTVAGVDFLTSTEIYDPTAGPWGSWVQGPSMANSRADHTATTFADGTVLVAGGRGPAGMLAGAELYLPSTQSWASNMGSMTTPRAAHTAALLQNGKVLVSGGFFNGNFQTTSSAELFDPITHTWTPTSSLSVVRNQHTATLLPNGAVLVAGGAGNGVPASSETYSIMDPVIDAGCASTSSHEAHQAVYPLHVPGPCPAAPAFTPGDASLACGGTKVKYQTYTCERFGDGTHGWTSYYGCCPSTCSGTGITFETRRFTGAPLPGSVVDAVYLFNHLPAGGAGYGAATLGDTASFSNHTSIAGGVTTNIASHLEVSFIVPANQAGVWAFRLGADYGFGGALLVDWNAQRPALDAYWKALHPNDGIDFHWGGVFSDPDVLKGTIYLGPGLHKIEAYGFENGNDGTMRLEVMAPGTGNPESWSDPAWKPISASTLDLCGDP